MAYLILPFPLITDREPTMEDYEQWAAVRRLQLRMAEHAATVMRLKEPLCTPEMWPAVMACPMADCQAQRGETPHLTAGRWSRDSDRQ